MFSTIYGRKIDGRACWDGYGPSIIQKFQEADVGVLVHRGKLQIELTPLELPMFCHLGMKHGFLKLVYERSSK